MGKLSDEKINEYKKNYMISEKKEGELTIWVFSESESNYNVFVKELEKHNVKFE